MHLTIKPLNTRTATLLRSVSQCWPELDMNFEISKSEHRAAQVTAGKARRQTSAGNPGQRTIQQVSLVANAISSVALRRAPIEEPVLALARNWPSELNCAKSCAGNPSAHTPRFCGASPWPPETGRHRRLRQYPSAPSMPSEASGKVPGNKW